MQMDRGLDDDSRGDNYQYTVISTAQVVIHTPINVRMIVLIFIHNLGLQTYVIKSF